MASTWGGAWGDAWATYWDRETTTAATAAILEFSVVGQRLHWKAAGAGVHYTMNVGRCHYDA